MQAFTVLFYGSKIVLWDVLLNDKKNDGADQMTFHQTAAISRAAAIRLVSDVPVLPNPATASVAVIGLGYVGLPLLAGFAKGGQVFGFDIDERKLSALRHGEDITGQVNATIFPIPISNSPVPPAR